MLGRRLIVKSPNFWNDKDSLCTKILYPISRTYGLIKAIQYNRVIAERVKAPVVCIGDIVVNGAGKTIAVAMVCRMLEKRGYKPHILSGKNGGYIRNVVRVDPNRHSYLQVGDEAILSSFVYPLWIGKDKIAAADAAISSGADVIVIDGGLQNNEVAKNFKILVMDSMQGIGNGNIYPAGFLKEDIKTGVKKADIVLIVGDKNEVLEKIILNIVPNMRIFYSVIEPIDGEKKLSPGEKVIAFCGIGSPAKFKKTLNEMKLDIIDFVSFPDHHPYTITESQKLVKVARNANAKLVTTMKDYIKIPDPFKNEVSVVDVKLSFTCDSFEDIMIKALSSDGWSSG
ncbi:MAG: tetraacyldisaccharide 4'-kinase [Holosporales bacterium]|nr:tetraacyldisaccharide 4'-kinase [Holosporales bacterium]